MNYVSLFNVKTSTLLFQFLYLLINDTKLFISDNFISEPYFIRLFYLIADVINLKSR